MTPTEIRAGEAGTESVGAPAIVIERLGGGILRMVIGPVSSVHELGTTIGIGTIEIGVVKEVGVPPQIVARRPEAIDLGALLPTSPVQSRRRLRPPRTSWWSRWRGQTLGG